MPAPTDRGAGGTPPHRRLTTRLIAIVAALALAGAVTAVAYAHAEPERSSPAADARVPSAPDRVDVWFTQELFRREGANSLVVEGPDGERVDDGESVIDTTDREHLSVGLQPDLPDGAYAVHWTTLSAIDGDAAEGSFTFTVDPSAPAPTATTPPAEKVSTATAASPSDDADETSSVLVDAGSSFPWWALIAAAAIVSSAGLGAWALLAADPGEARD